MKRSRLKRTRWERKPDWKRLERKTRVNPVSKKRAEQHRTFNAERSIGEACYKCGVVNPDGFMEGHHELEASAHPQLKGDAGNRLPACRSCHQAVTDDRKLDLEVGEDRPRYEIYLAAKRQGLREGYEVDGYGNRIEGS